ncbi:MAG: hypothetical protein ACOCV2_09050 [Persicimonas sp.]
MPDRSDKACAERLRMAIDLAESGMQMRLAQLRREHPDASDAEINRRFKEWLLDRPGAEFGDAEGRPIDPSTILNP